MITVIVHDELGTELDRFQMIHTAFENPDKFPPTTFKTSIEPASVPFILEDNQPYYRLVRAAYFQGRGGGG